MTLNFETMSEQQLWAIANPIMDNLMDASTQRDHSRHVRDFTERLKAIVTPDYLQCVCQQYQAEKGYFITRTPVAIFRRPDSAAIDMQLARIDFIFNAIIASFRTSNSSSATEGFKLWRLSPEVWHG